MTLLPCAAQDIKPTVKLGPEPEAEVVCAHPACANRGALEPHHVVRRTATGGPVRWVIVNGVVLLNVRMFCHVHHSMLTGEIGGHRAWIRYLSGQGWVWYAPTPLAPAGAVLDKLGAAWVPVGPLKGVM